MTILIAAALQASPVGTGELQVESEALTADSLQAFYLASLPRLRVGLVGDLKFIVTDLPNPPAGWDSQPGMSSGSIKTPPASAGSSIRLRMPMKNSD